MVVDLARLQRHYSTLPRSETRKWSLSRNWELVTRGDGVQLWNDDPLCHIDMMDESGWGVRGVTMWTASSANYPMRARHDAAGMWVAFSFPMHVHNFRL